MAKVSTRYRRSVRKQRQPEQPLKITGDASLIRFSSLKLQPVSGAVINGDGLSHYDIHRCREVYDVATTAGLMKFHTKPIKNRLAFFQKLADIHKEMNDKYDHFCLTSCRTKIKGRPDGSSAEDVFAGMKYLGIDDGCYYYELEDVEKHEPEVQKVILSCLHLITKMGFGTLDDMVGFDYFMQPGYGNDTVQEIREEIISDRWGDEGEMDSDDKLSVDQIAHEIIFYKKYNFKKEIRYYKELVQQYARRNDDLGEWCKLCLLYGNNGFNIGDFQPAEITGDDIQPVTAWESHLIVRNTKDYAFNEHCQHVDVSHNEAGTLAICNYELRYKGKVVRPMKKPQDYGVEDFMTLSDDIDRIWNFNIPSLSFH